jgi:hypothetical protein
LYNDDIYIKSQREGWKAALGDFRDSTAPEIPFPLALQERVFINAEFFFKHEFKPFIEYIPDFECLKENNVNIVAAVGVESDDAYYVQSTKEIASRLRCPCVHFPGQHIAYFYLPEEFSNALKNIIYGRDLDN